MARKQRPENSSIQDFVSKIKAELQSIKTEDELKIDIKTNTPVDLIVPSIPLGRVTTIYGPESSGKTTYALHLAKAFQKNGGYVFWIDVENSFSEVYAKSIGVDLDDKFVLIKESDELLTIEYVFSIMEEILQKFSEEKDAPPSILVWDSIAVTPSAAEVESTFESTKPVAASAQALSFGLKKLSPYLAKTPNLAILIITQVRSRMNISWGQIDYDMYGGRSLKHYQSLALEFRRIKSERFEREENSVTTDVIVQKSKLPNVLFGNSVKIVITHGVGINTKESLFNIAKDLKLIDTRGGYYCFSKEVPEELRSIDGRENFRKDEIADLLTQDKYFDLIYRKFTESK